METNYLNTDLDVLADFDLTPFTDELERKGMLLLDVSKRLDGTWSARLEEGGQSNNPEDTCAALLKVIESLTPEYRAIWSRCTLREFNLGYDCGLEPWAFQSGISAEIVRRIADLGASLRVTLYPIGKDVDPTH